MNIKPKRLKVEITKDGAYIGREDDSNDHSVSESSDLAKIKAFLEYHGFEFEEDNDGIPHIRINFDHDGNVR